MVDESFIAAEAPPDGNEPVPEKGTLPEAPLPRQAEIQQMLAEMKQTLTEFMQQSRPELEKMQTILHNTVQERDNHATELKQIKASQALQNIAADYSFNDVEYLDFILQKNNISSEDHEAVKTFMRELKKSKPRFFDLQLKPGAGSRPGTSAGNVLPGSEIKRMDALEMLISHAREIN